jgi:hypothetical protein
MSRPRRTRFRRRGKAKIARREERRQRILQAAAEAGADFIRDYLRRPSFASEVLKLVEVPGAVPI